MQDDTIFAVASGAGRAAVAVLRLSGPDSARLLGTLAGALPAPRRASLRRLRDAGGAELDHALVLWFPGPASYTGEDCAELHLHGGRAVIDGLAQALVALGARPAEPGEFTRRAFLNGQMDLIEAEAIADLVDAETSAQRAQALRQMDGALGAIYRDWAERLRVLSAQQEALIDFPDEDLPEETETQALAELDTLRAEIGAHLDDGRRGERLREGLVFAITGPPNVGKSSLMNALAEREVAIVSDQPGTTRDALETRVVLGSVPVTLVDTAGLREAADAIEAEGVRRALARAEAADLVVVVGVADSPPSWPGLTRPSPQHGAATGGRVKPSHDGVHGDSTSLPTPPALPAPPILHVTNKIDLGAPVPSNTIGVSALTGIGLDILRTQLATTARALTDTAGPPPLTRARHRAALQEAAGHLLRATDADLPELRAEDLRLALRALGRITGQVGVEDLLGTIFSRFCIGK
jgi:tRNA modification GTPase